MSVYTLTIRYDGLLLSLLLQMIDLVSEKSGNIGSGNCSRKLTGRRMLRLHQSEVVEKN